MNADSLVKVKTAIQDALKSKNTGKMKAALILANGYLSHAEEAPAPDKEKMGMMAGDMEECKMMKGMAKDTAKAVSPAEGTAKPDDHSHRHD